MPSVRIVGLAVVAAVLYGICQDQVTARVCVEYFTVGHPPLFDTDSPTLLAIGWGTVATWWVGLPLGVGLAVAATAGRAPVWTATRLVRPILRLLSFVAVAATLAGFGGWVAAHFGLIRLTPSLAQRIGPDRQAVFLADGAAHLSSYVVGGLGGLVLIAWVWVSRRKELVQRTGHGSGASEGRVAQDAPTGHRSDAELGRRAVMKLLLLLVPHAVALAADAAVSGVLLGILYVVLVFWAASTYQPLGGLLALPFMVLVGLLGGAVAGAVVTGPLTLLSTWLAGALSRPSWWSPLIHVAIVLLAVPVSLAALPSAWDDIPTSLLVATGAVVLGAQAVVHWVFRTMTAVFLARVARPAA